MRAIARRGHQTVCDGPRRRGLRTGRSHRSRITSPRPALPPRVTPAGAERVAAYPTYYFPLARSIHDGLLVVNYVDLDPTAGLLDYSSGTHTYDGHRGIDYTLYDFRLMDRGCAVRAASPGTVAYMSAPSPYDRHCDFNWPDDGNWV